MFDRTMQEVIDALSNTLLQLRNRHFMLIDVVVFLLTPGLALALRLDNFFNLEVYILNLTIVTIVFLAVKLSVLYKFGVYKHYWRYASIDELTKIIVLIAAAVVLQILLFYSLFYWSGFYIKNLPRSLPLLDGMLSLILIGGLRFSVRAVERASQKHKKLYQCDRLLIVGAGSAGVALVQEMQQSPCLGFYPVAFIDDNPEKLNLCVRGLSVVGDRHKIPEVVQSLNICRVIIAMPSVSGKVIREIVDICQSIGVETITLPGIHEILNGRVGVGSLREVKLEDLLRRAPIQTDVQDISRFFKGKKVLLTGAGGSIGSELCRQILKCRPAEMILLGHGENSIFRIRQELEQVLEVLRKDGEAQGHIPLINTFIADIRFLSRLEYAFKQFRPEIILHAAAHKHVPLMELDPPEAITNNVLGTKNLLDLALLYDVKHFVMISTDKAVNPTSVMGASKRTAEMLVLQTAQKSGKPFVVVRFGNVLGSRGSVVPTFRRQIAMGGPITITHPEICRYFMTIPEAVQLVLQASVIGRGGEVFMFNMGQPVKIVDLAKDLILLSGYEVGKDIDIKFTGLRPGEKLFEELFISGEQYESTQHEKIFIVQNASRIISENLTFGVEALCEAAVKNNSPSVVFLLKHLVPEYIPETLKVSFKEVLEKKTCTQSHRLGYEPSFKKALNRPMSASAVLLPVAWENLLQPLDNQAFQLHYQPIVHLETNRVISFEALLRWQHPQRGLVFPGEFMSVAEETGLIIPIGWWVLREACHQMKAWQQKFPVSPPLTISVNLSGRQFVQPDLSKQIEQIIQETALDACSLRLEIAESVLMENSESATAKLLLLKALGVQLQIDQLGIGYSFLNRLQCLPNLSYCKEFDRLKVDRSLISQIDVDEESLEIVQKIVAITHDLGMDITAAGVETARQLDHLRAIKCEYGQGYLFSMPVEKEAASTLVATQIQLV